MKTLILASVVILGGCASTKMEPLRDMTYVADGWLLAAYDQEHRVTVQGIQLQPIPYSNKTVTESNYFTKQIIVQPGDTVQSIAFYEYGDPHMWDIIAMANDLELPYSIEPWTMLVIPQDQQESTQLINPVELDHWKLRITNSGREAVCAKIDFMDIDYHKDIDYGWYVVPVFETVYVGTITQQPWVLANELFAFDDAAWVVNKLNIVPYKEGSCDIS